MIRLNPAIKKFFSYAKPYRWWIFGATFFGVLKFNIPLVFPWIFKDVIDYLLNDHQPRMTAIHINMLILIGLYVLWTVVTYYRSYIADQASQRLIFDLRQDLWGHLQRMWIGYYEKRQVGSISSRLLTDTALAQNLVGAAVTNTIMDLSTLLVITILIFSMNWKLAVVSILVLPAYVFFNKFFKRQILSTSKQAQQKMEKIAGDVTEKLGGISIIQSYTLEKAEEHNFFRENRDYLRYRLANSRYNALAQSVIGFLTSVAPVLVIWSGAYLVIRQQMTVGELTAFYVYLGMFYGPLNRLTDLNIMIANSQSAIERIYDVFSTSPEVVDLPSARPVIQIGGKITFVNVNFGYNPSVPVLKGINIDIPKGSTHALVGPSGSGKSTFVKLIPRFYNIDEGRIEIDGVDIRELQVKSLRKKIAMVPQEAILFSGTIFENIQMGKPEADYDEVEEAARSANAHEFILSLPMGYQTQIVEAGLNLSGGQKQRLSLARAFLKNAPILILDEATSALDSRSENLIQEALERLMKNRTTLIIAHRLSTIQSADNIVVFDKGRIAEIGSHNELLGKPGGLYSSLYHEQFQYVMRQ